MQFTNQLLLEFRHKFLCHKQQLLLIVAYRIVTFSLSNRREGPIREGRKEGPRREGRKKEGVYKYSFSFSTQK